MTNFALPPPVQYKPPSTLYAYRHLVLLFIAIFIGVIALALHEIQVQRSRPLPLVPVYIDRVLDKAAAAKPAER